MALAGNNLIIPSQVGKWHPAGAGDGKIDNLFYSVSGRLQSTYSLVCGVNTLLLHQVKAEWAFKVYDYNEDEKIDGEDIKRVVMDIIGRNRSVQDFRLIFKKRKWTFLCWNTLLVLR